MKKTNESIVRSIAGRGRGSFAVVTKDNAVAEEILNYVVSLIYKIDDFRESHPDIMIIGDGDKSIGVNEAREVHDFLKYSENTTRLIILNHLGHANEQAINALLKPVEEPRDNVLFILIAPNVDARLATVLSRCVVFRADVDCGTAYIQSHVDVYKYLLKGGVPVSCGYGDVLGGLYLYVFRTIKRYVGKEESDELFPGETACCSELDNFAYEIMNIFDFVYKAIEMKLNVGYISMVLRRKLLDIL